MTVEDLIEKRNEELERQQGLKNRILCCTAAGCISCGADGVKQALAKEVEAQGRGGVEVCGTGCMGMCGRGPLVLSSADQHLHGNKQVKIVLANSGRVDPEKLTDYIAAGGYQSLAKALEMTPREVVEEVKKVGCAGAGVRDIPRG